MIELKMIFWLFVVALIFNMYVGIRLLTKKESPIKRQFVFQPEIIAQFNGWFDSQIDLAANKFISKKKGDELIGDAEIPMTDTFAKELIAYVMAECANNMPEYFRVYMGMFYGDEKKFANAMYERIRLIAVKLIDNIIRMRLGKPVEIPKHEKDKAEI